MLGQSSILPATNSVSDNSPVASPASGSDLGLGSTTRLVGSLPADSPDATEGGYVEIDNIPLASGRFTPAQQTPMWSLDGANTDDPLTRGGQHEDLLRGTGGIAKEDDLPADARSNDIVQLELGEQNSAISPNAAEGGMVELAAAAPQDTQPISTKSPAGRRPSSQRQRNRVGQWLGTLPRLRISHGANSTRRPCQQRSTQGERG